MRRRCLRPAERARFEQEVPHLFAENAGAGERNGDMAAKLARAKGLTILRGASGDNTRQAQRQSCERFGQHRRVAHLLEGAPGMIIANLCTKAGLVNGATGTILAVKLKGSLRREEVHGAVSAADAEGGAVAMSACPVIALTPGIRSYARCH